MDKIATIQKIASYIKVAYEWHEAGEGLLAESYFEKMTELEEEILTSFGLPFMAFQYSEILQNEGFSIENIEKRAELLIKKLRKEARKYLLAPIEKDSTILANARLQRQDIVEVLPLIGFGATAYNCFIYYNKFFRDIYDNEEALKLFKISAKLDEQPATRIPHTYNGLVTNGIYKKLTNVGLPYLNEFKHYLKYKETDQEWNRLFDNNDLRTGFTLHYIFSLKHFYITEILLKNEFNCCVSIIFKKGKSYVELSIWCVESMMRVFMLNAKYYSLAIPPLYLLSPKFLKPKSEIRINLLETIGKNIEIENIEIELERLDDEDDEIQNPFAYVITDLKVIK